MHYLPNPDHALAYDQLVHEPDFQQACGHYIARHFGSDVATGYLIVTYELQRLVIVGYTEPQALETLTAMLGFPTLKAAASL